MHAAPPGITIRTLTNITEQHIHQLGDVIIATVESGGAAGFMKPMTRAKADTFWRHVADCVTHGHRILLAAENKDGAIVGTVQLILNLPENQPHRADIAKMLVHPSARRQGIAAALLAAAEQAALTAGRHVLVLDTATGSDAQRLYQRCGWQRTGEIPNYARWPDGAECSTTIFYKNLAK